MNLVPNTRQKYEYLNKAYRATDLELTLLLNDKAEEGWEVVAVATMEEYESVYFRREMVPE